ncbi:hypothetical protein BU17DRAFT_82840 [Hysterangium stoloniferum]|nr:hypothetical protein BU17DRAFT_82840 [Hysterangium stoloniferum]
MPYGERWRKHRHVFQNQYTPVQTNHSRNLLQQLHELSKNWELHIRHTISAVVVEITYGIDILPENDPYITTAEFTVGLLLTIAGSQVVVFDALLGKSFFVVVAALYTQSQSFFDPHSCSCTMAVR